MRPIHSKQQRPQSHTSGPTKKRTARRLERLEGRVDIVADHVAALERDRKVAKVVVK